MLGYEIFGDFLMRYENLKGNLDGLSIFLRKKIPSAQSLQIKILFESEIIYFNFKDQN